MKHAGKMLVTAGLFAAVGAIGVARAEDEHTVTLYTGIFGSGVFHCNAVNVSNKTLSITIAVLGNGAILAEPVTTTTAPGAEASNDYGATTNPSIDGYCEFAVLGTRDPDDVRAVLNANRASTFTLPGSATPIPFYVSRVLQAH